MAEGDLHELRLLLLRSTKDFAALPANVWKRTSALNTWGTNAIEGNTLTAPDVERLLLRDETVGGRPASDVVETIQHEQAFRRLWKRRTSPIDLPMVQEIHEDVFRGIAAYLPGRWRLTNPYIAGTSYRPPRREKVVAELEGWLSDYQRAERAENVFDVAARFHHRFESIHPFENGNGRVGRLLLNLHFLRHRWPPVHITPFDRRDYLAALDRGHSQDLGPLRTLLVGAMGRSLLDLMDQLGGAEHELRPLRTYVGPEWGSYASRSLNLRAKKGDMLALWSHDRSALQAPAKRGRPEFYTSPWAIRRYLANRRRRGRPPGKAPSRPT